VKEECKLATGVPHNVLLCEGGVALHACVYVCACVCVCVCVRLPLQASVVWLLIMELDACDI